MDMQVVDLTVVGCILLLGYYAGLGAKRIGLPSLIGYMTLGVVLGPSAVGLFDADMTHSLAFLTQIALGFVAFSIGSELKIQELKRLGGGIVAIIFAESFCAFGAVTAAIYLLTRDLPLSLIFGAVAPASAPAGTVAVIQECRARGPLTKALYAVVGFDDGLAIFIFGFAAALAKSLLVAEVSGVHENILAAMAVPAKEVLLSLLVGGVIGFAFGHLARAAANPRETLVFVFGTVLLATGLAEQYHLSLILTNMMVGFILVNTRREDLVTRVGEQLLHVMPLLFILFFCMAGVHLDLDRLPALGAVGVVYILARTAGLIGGARLGGAIGRVQETVKRWIGLGILSQAGVAIGLSLIVSHEFRVLGSAHAAAIATQVITTITATCIFFEIVGPIGTRIALTHAGEAETTSGAGPH